MTLGDVNQWTLASGKLSAHVYGHLYVVTDSAGAVLSVGLYCGDDAPRSRPRVTRASAGDAAMMTLRARWTGVLPRVGEYLMSQHRPRCAYVLVVDPPSIISALRRSPDAEVAVTFKVERVGLPLPAGAVVHAWKWDARGKNTGVRHV